MTKKILLVDDSNTVLLLHQMTLRSSGYQLLVARDGEEAVQRARAERPDLILMDVVMPRMNGIEACRRIREEDATRHVPIIMVTTRGEPVNVEMGYQAGCNEYLTKPFDGRELMACVRNYLGE